MIRRPPRSTLDRSSAASDVYKRQDFWRARFGGRRDVIGQSITLDEEPHTIIGVLPPNAHLPQLEFVDLWRPVHVSPRDEERRDWHGFLAFVRLRNGASLD